MDKEGIDQIMSMTSIACMISIFLVCANLFAGVRGASSPIVHKVLSILICTELIVQTIDLLLRCTPYRTGHHHRCCCCQKWSKPALDLMIIKPFIQKCTQSHRWAPHQIAHLATTEVRAGSSSHLLTVWAKI